MDACESRLNPEDHLVYGDGGLVAAATI
jgi:hypothetical protein